MTFYRGRFAPSPTGELHLGSGLTALVAFARARAAGGRFVLRIEDLDTPRVIAGAEAEQMKDLAWLGIAWDEGPSTGGPFAPYRQSERTLLYEIAITELASQGLTYLCDCSRAEIARVASAPHAGDDGPRYPGTCRAHGMKERVFKRLPSIRLAVPDDERAHVSFVDAIAGPIEEGVGRVTGDFVLRRGDGVFAYQLAVVVDDLAMGITEVVRGADLLGSTGRQILLARLLGGTAPSFAHVPLVVGPDGGRLAKRAPRMTLKDQREGGRDPSDLAMAAARALGARFEQGDVIGALADPASWTRADKSAPIDVSLLAGA
jgi:glutamyl-tRNA synthetase